MIHVSAVPSVAPDQARTINVPDGSTVAQIVRAAFPATAKELAPRLVVEILTGRHAGVVDRTDWAGVTPEAGAAVLVRLTPGDPVTAWLTSTIATSFGVASTTSFAYSAISVGVGLATSALISVAINALTPQPEIRDPESYDATYALNGWQNRATLGSAFPLVMGRTRMAPVYFQMPYREVVGRSQYLRAGLTWGYGRLDISDLWLGDTPMEDYSGIEYEIREGVEGDLPVTITPEVVVPVAEAITLKGPDYEDDLGYETDELFYHSVKRYTDTDTEQISLIFAFPSGLANLDKDGTHKQTTVRVQVDLRLYADREDDEAWIDAGELAFTDEYLNPVYFQETITPPSAGKWQIRLTRTTEQGDSDDELSDLQWIETQSIRKRHPFDPPAPMAHIAVRVEAGEQLNGQISALTGVVQRYAPCWTGTDWEEGLTENPAGSLMAYHQGPWLRSPSTEDGIRLDDMQALWEFCEANGLTFNGRVDDASSFPEALARIAGAGRASPRYDGARHGVVIDRADDDANPICDHINAANSWGLSGTREPLDPPDAVRVQFLNAEDDFGIAEITTLWPDFEGDPDVIEEWELPGKLYPREVAIELYRRILEAIYRRSTWRVMQEGPLRVATRGSRVNLSHYILSSKQISARVVDVVGNAVLIDQPVTMEAGTSYVLHWHMTSAADVRGQAVVTIVRPQEGETQTLGLKGYIPPAGTSVTFAPATETIRTCRVLGIVPGEDGTVELRLTEDAPEIDTELADYEPPEFNTVVGQPSTPGDAPSQPLIRNIWTDTLDGVLTVFVSVRMAASDTSTISGYTVDYRLSGAAGWSSAGLGGTSGSIQITGYSVGDEIEVRAAAQASGGAWSEFTDTIYYTVGEELEAAPNAVPSDSVTISGELGRAVITAWAGGTTRTADVFRTASGGTFDDDTDYIGTISFASGQTQTFVDGGAETSTKVEISGMSAAASWNISGNSATHTAGTADRLFAPLTTYINDVVRGAITISGRTAGDVEIRMVDGSDVASGGIFESNGVHYFEFDPQGHDAFEVYASAPFDGTVSDLQVFKETSSSAPQGAWEYRLRAENSDGLTAGISGPYTTTII
ncbi:hypothetical protein KO516_06580 [Citreicella sp. C3M06]|uniref:TipJ family phage tail tip protein n=1 Tax=Citreicella sp. C3M06 TaxID=2841564 RepID=UPI001C0863D8|nr:hypothetical protein [Citreicella sp. C3M06]MBU2960484.1 hypothetical protein [Citreicella sp. C3M06]